jgi:hypothetical protein
MKRSSQVALLLMGVGSVGATAYAMAPARDCTAPAQQGTVAPGLAATDVAAQAQRQAQNPCPPRRSWSSYSSGHRSSSHWSRPIFSGWHGTTTTSTAPVVRTSGSSTFGTLRGGFGSIAHAFSARAGG